MCACRRLTYRLPSGTFRRVTTTGTSRTVLVANQKGGVGKSSIVSAVAGMVAAAGRRVLVVDADQQANVSSSDLGVEGDKGRGLSMALQFAEPLTPTREVRPNLDVIPGGPALAVVTSVAATAQQTGIDLQGNLTRTLNNLRETEKYDLVLIDSGPGDAPLLEALLGTARYLLVPTKDDDASLSGVELLATRYLRARKSGSQIQLLGVVLFDTNPRATARNREVFDQVHGLTRSRPSSARTVRLQSTCVPDISLRWNLLRLRNRTRRTG
jgi:chromosome partitioning protein